MRLDKFQTASRCLVRAYQMKFKSHLSRVEAPRRSGRDKREPQGPRIAGKGIFNWPPNKSPYNLQNKRLFFTAQFVTERGFNYFCKMFQKNNAHFLIDSRGLVVAVSYFRKERCQIRRQRQTVEKEKNTVLFHSHNGLIGPNGHLK